MHDDDQESNKPRREIKSFVLRQGRFTEAQKRAFDIHWAAYGIDFSSRLDLQTGFAKPTPVVMEIGIGNGDAILHAAKHDPSRNYLGIEVHKPGVGRVMNGAADAALENFKVMCHDAVEVLRESIPDGALDEVRVYFPDPWHKARHNKRRLIQPAFVQLLRQKIRVGGLLHLATDWQHYAEQMLEVCDAAEGFENLAGKGHYSERPVWRIQTHFERRGLKLGHGVWDLLYRKNN